MLTLGTRTHRVHTSADGGRHWLRCGSDLTKFTQARPG